MTAGVSNFWTFFKYFCSILTWKVLKAYFFVVKSVKNCQKCCFDQQTLVKIYTKWSSIWVILCLNLFFLRKNWSCFQVWFGHPISVMLTILDKFATSNKGKIKFHWKYILDKLISGKWFYVKAFCKQCGPSLLTNAQL